MSISKIITPTGLTVFVSGQKPFMMARSHKLFEQMLDAIRLEDVEEIVNLINLAEHTATYMKGSVVIKDGELFYEGEAIHGTLVDRIMECMDEDIDETSLINFLKNLMQNPSKQSRDELYLFLEACGDLPITEDGRFIAYKWVRDDYKDCHSGTFDNSVGSVVTMPRGKVNDDRRQTCSSGLHVCSNKYMKFGQRLMLVAINPKDVVSVPYDYDNGKMRVCEYEVIGEIEEAEYKEFSTPVYNY